MITLKERDPELDTGWLKERKIGRNEGRTSKCESLDSSPWQF